MRAITIVGIRLIGAYFLISAIATALVMWSSWAMLQDITSIRESFVETRAVVLIAQSAMALFGCLLIAFSVRISLLLTSDLGTEQTVSPSTQQLTQIGTALLGLYFAAVGAIGLVVFALLKFQTFSFLGAGQPDQTAEAVRQTANGGFALVRVIVGVGLCVLARPFSRLPFASDSSADTDS